MLRETLVDTNGENTITEVSGGNESVKAMGEDLGPGVMPDTWDSNRVYLYEDPDGNKVPVPYGFTVSGAESERYVNHNVTKTGMLTDLTFSSSGDYAWTQDENNVWVSGNYNVHSTESELVSDEITVGEDGGYLSIEWSVSSDIGSDLLSITITNTDTGTAETPTNISGTKFGTNYNSLVYTKYNTELGEGHYAISLKYTKNASSNSGLDRGYVKGGTILNYDNKGTDEATIHEYGGLVIYEGTDTVTDANAWEQSKARNQFVWVPVADSSRIYERSSTTGKIKAKLYDFTATGRTLKSSQDTDIKPEAGILSGNYDVIKLFSKYGMLGYTKELLYKELESEFLKTIISIEKYGGFYVGRYETGNVSSENPVVKRLNSDVGSKTNHYETWYTMYSKMKNISNNSNVQTSMIWGSLFDELLEWIIESGDKTQADVVLDSSSWGNYQHVSFLYTNINGIISHKQRGANIIPTGGTERNKANNTYDIAGNVYEYTLEGTPYNGRYCRVCRGGSFQYNSYSSASNYRYNYYAPNYERRFKYRIGLSSISLY